MESDEEDLEALRREIRTWPWTRRLSLLGRMIRLFPPDHPDPELRLRARKVEARYLAMRKRLAEATGETGQDER